MTHLNVTWIAWDGVNPNGMGIDNATGDVVVVKNNVVIGRWKATGLDTMQPGEARGDVMRYGAAGWEGHPAKTAGQVVAGDGTDAKSMPLTTDVTLTHSAGNLIAKLGALFRSRGVTSDATAGAYTYLAAGMKLGLILRDPSGADRADLTDTAANILAAIPESDVGSFIDFVIANVADAAETITLNAGVGITLDPAIPTIARGEAALFRAVKTGAATVTVYQMSNRAKLVQDLGAQAVAFLDSTGVGADGETVTIGARIYELDTHSGAGSVTPGNVRVDVSGGSTVKSQGTLNFNSLPLNNETVTIDGKAYTFQDVLTEADGNVLIAAADIPGTIDNLVAAVMLGAGGGVNYAAATTIHPTVTSARAANTMIATAKAGGVGGDAITTADGLSDVLSVWDGPATLGTTTAGVSPTAAEVGTAIVAAINADASRVMDARDAGAGTVLLVTKAIDGTLPALAEASANIAISAAAAVGGALPAVRIGQTLRRVITAQDQTTLTDAGGIVPIGGIAATVAPANFIVQVRTGGGAVKPCANVAWSWVQANTNWFILQASDGGAGTSDMVATDIATAIVIA